MESSSVLRAALVDDHEIVGFALAAAIKSIDGLEYVGVAPTVDRLLAGHPQVDLVVLDLRLADGSSPIGNVDKLVTAGAAVIAYTSGENPGLIRLAAKTPVLGIVRKSAPVSVLVDALRAAMTGDVLMSPEWAAAMVSDPALPDAHLSPREREVLALLASGAKAQVVSSTIGIAVGTVDDYVRRIRAKYARVGRPAHNRIDLYQRALEDGILPLPGDR